jgi:hypothetical protein
MSIFQVLNVLTPVRRWAWRAVFAVILLSLAGANFTVAQMWYFQIRSASYPVVEGVVLGHKKSVPEEKQPLVIEYAYEVNGERFTSNRYWYEAFGTTVNDDDAAARFPVGARVAVSYNPADPADAVLIPGLQGADVLAGWALVALHLLMLSFAFLGHVADGTDYTMNRRILPTPFGWRLIPNIERIWPAFVLALLITMFIGLCVTNGWANAFSPLWEVLGLSAAVVAGAVGATVAWAYLLRERVWLEVDVDKRELRWHSGGLARPVTIPFEVVTDVRAIEHEYSPGKLVYWPQIVWLTPQRRTRIVELPASIDRDAVDAAVALIRDAVFGATAPSPDPAAS